VASAAAELTTEGYRLLHGTRTEPWEQITARLMSPEGLLVAVSLLVSGNVRTTVRFNGCPRAPGLSSVEYFGVPAEP
jgi:hypothetical protein